MFTLHYKRTNATIAISVNIVEISQASCPRWKETLMRRQSLKVIFPYIGTDVLNELPAILPIES